LILFGLQEKATKYQKHVMLFWESKLIHKLRGKSKFMPDVCVWVLALKLPQFSNS